MATDQDAFANQVIEPLQDLKLVEGEFISANSFVTNGKDGKIEDVVASGEQHQDDLEEIEPDIAIIQALLDPRERQTAFRCEDYVIKFLSDTSKEVLEFPGDFTSYQKMLAHRVSQYYRLSTSTVDYEAGNGRVVATRTESSRIPKVKVSELDPKHYAQALSQLAGKTHKILRRPQRHDSHASEGATGKIQFESQTKSAKDREEEYHQARERIVGKDMEDLPKRAGRNGSSRNSAGRGGRGQKAIFRDKEQEAQDPDYSRNFPRYAPMPYAMGTHGAMAPMMMPTMVPTYTGFPGPEAYGAMMAAPVMNPYPRAHIPRPNAAAEPWGSSIPSATGGPNPPPPPPPPNSKGPSSLRSSGSLRSSDLTRAGSRSSSMQPYPASPAIQMYPVQVPYPSIMAGMPAPTAAMYGHSGYAYPGAMGIPGSQFGYMPGPQGPEGMMAMGMGPRGGISYAPMYPGMVPQAMAMHSPAGLQPGNVAAFGNGGLGMYPDAGSTRHRGGVGHYYAEGPSAESEEGGTE